MLLIQNGVLVRFKIDMVLKLKIFEIVLGLILLSFEIDEISLTYRQMDQTYFLCFYNS